MKKIMRSISLKDIISDVELMNLNYIFELINELRKKIFYIKKEPRYFSDKSISNFAKDRINAIKPNYEYLDIPLIDDSEIIKLYLLIVNRAKKNEDIYNFNHVYSFVLSPEYYYIEDNNLYWMGIIIDRKTKIDNVLGTVESVLIRKENEEYFITVYQKININEIDYPIKENVYNLINGDQDTFFDDEANTVRYKADLYPVTSKYDQSFGVMSKIHILMNVSREVKQSIIFNANAFYKLSTKSIEESYDDFRTICLRSSTEICKRSIYKLNWEYWRNVFLWYIDEFLAIAKSADYSLDYWLNELRVPGGIEQLRRGEIAIKEIGVVPCEPFSTQVNGNVISVRLVPFGDTITIGYVKAILTIVKSDVIPFLPDRLILNQMSLNKYGTMSKDSYILQVGLNNPKCKKLTYSQIGKK